MKCRRPSPRTGCCKWVARPGLATFAVASPPSLGFCDTSSPGQAEQTNDRVRGLPLPSLVAPSEAPFEAPRFAPVAHGRPILPLLLGSHMQPSQTAVHRTTAIPWHVDPRITTPFSAICCCWDLPTCRVTAGISSPRRTATNRPTSTNSRVVFEGCPIADPLPRIKKCLLPPTLLAPHTRFDYPSIGHCVALKGLPLVTVPSASATAITISAVPPEALYTRY